MRTVTSGFHKGYTGAAENHTLGFVQNFPRDAVYKLVFTFDHTGTDLELVLTGLTVPQGVVQFMDQDETWGIGRLVVNTD